MKKILNIILAILIVGLTATISILFVKTDTEWFNNLTKPDFYPESIIFSIAWIIVYIITAFVITRLLLNSKSKKTFILLLIQCALQIIWCAVFFMLEMPVLALFILIALVIINNIITIFLFTNDELAAWLYFIVFCWFVYAAMLNYSIVMLN